MSAVMETGTFAAEVPVQYNHIVSYMSVWTHKVGNTKCT